jgi:hypothetical protein
LLLLFGKIRLLVGGAYAGGLRPGELIQSTWAQRRSVSLQVVSTAGLKGGLGRLCDAIAGECGEAVDLMLNYVATGD